MRISKFSLDFAMVFYEEIIFGNTNKKPIQLSKNDVQLHFMLGKTKLQLTCGCLSQLSSGIS